MSDFGFNPHAGLGYEPMSADQIRECLTRDNPVRTCSTCRHSDPRWCNLAMDKTVPADKWSELVRYRDIGVGSKECNFYEKRT